MLCARRLRHSQFRVGLPPIYDVETPSDARGLSLNMLKIMVSLRPRAYFMLRVAKGYCDVGTSCSIAQVHKMFWHSFLAGQPPVRSVLCRTVRGGTVSEHGLRILAGGKIDFCTYEHT